jgi:hypothetical protein
MWSYEGLETITKENQIDFDLGSCVKTPAGTISIEKYGKSFFVDQESCGTANLASSGINGANAEEVQVCSDLIEARCAELGTPVRISESAIPPFCPCWEEQELEKVRREDLTYDNSCANYSGDDGQYNNIQVIDQYFEVQIYAGEDTLAGCSSSYGGYHELREADAQVCYSQIEAKCAAIPPFCPCWEEQELEKVRWEDVNMDDSCENLSGDFGQYNNIQVIEQGGYFDISIYAGEDTLPACYSQYGGYHQLRREADAQVCYSQIEAKCAAIAVASATSAPVAATCPCSVGMDFWSHDGLDSVTKENQMDFKYGSCVMSPAGTISIERDGKSFFVEQGGCGTANLASSGIEFANAEEVQVCSDLIEARCAELGTPIQHQ